MSPDRTPEVQENHLVITPAPRRRSRLLATGAVLAGATVAGCAQDAPQDTWKPKGNNAQKIHDLQWPVFLVAGIVGVIVLAAVAYTIWKYRDRGQALPKQSHGRTSVEVGLTALSALILAVISVPTVGVIFDLADKGDTECVINVTGQQWWWEYDYVAGDCGGTDIPETFVVSGQLVIPVGVNVMLNVTSRDVIHSYWIPALNGKKDAVPGRVHNLRMQANEPGIYPGQCTEFCGLSHARMRMEAVALNPADFATWVNNQLEGTLGGYTSPAEGSVAADGESAFISQCAFCHQVDGLVNSQGDPVIANPAATVYSGAAPNLSNLMTRTTFAGATWDLLLPECKERLVSLNGTDEFGAEYLKGVTPDCLNEVELREWIRAAGEKKPMYVNAEQLEGTDGKYRGMPTLNIADDQLDLLIAYLLERR
jgi:cytochrome c oxidase subunit II